MSAAEPWLTEIQEKWLAALESGEYKQSSGALRTTNGFCCMGVACDVVDPNGWNFPGYENMFTHALGENEQRAYPGDKLLEALGISWQTARDLGRMNDGWITAADGVVQERSTFKEIVVYLREIFAANAKENK